MVVCEASAIGTGICHFQTLLEFLEPVELFEP